MKREHPPPGFNTRNQSARVFGMFGTCPSTSAEKMASTESSLSGMFPLELRRAKVQVLLISLA